MLGAFWAEPIMPSNVLPVILMPMWSGAASATPAPAGPIPASACIVADPLLASDPPAWLLLAAAVLLLGAGRLAAS